MKKTKIKKYILQFDLNGNFLDQFESIKAAERCLAIPHIKEVCDGKAKSTGGYVFKYESEDNE